MLLAKFDEGQYFVIGPLVTFKLFLLLIFLLIYLLSNNNLLVVVVVGHSAECQKVLEISDFQWLLSFQREKFSMP